MQPGLGVACFGEVLWRFSSPEGEALLQSGALAAHLGGAEANVAAALARLGRRARMVSILPDNRLGRAALEELRRHGVDCDGLRLGPGRMGFYFLTPGAALRPSEVLYDRAGSAFSLAEADAIDWDAELDGAGWLHLSGVTPALGAGPAEAALRAARAARVKGLKVCFDGNYRSRLWLGREGEAPAVLRALLEQADIALVDERDLELVLGHPFSGADAMARRRAAAHAAFEAFPNLARVASTVRIQQAVDRHDLSAVMFTREGEHLGRCFALAGVVDRIGSGDAFAAGLLHGLLWNWDDPVALDFALAAAVLKHAYKGDVTWASEQDVRDLLEGGGLDVRR